MRAVGDTGVVVALEANDVEVREAGFSGGAALAAESIQLP